MFDEIVCGEQEQIVVFLQHNLVCRLYSNDRRIAYKVMEVLGFGIGHDSRLKLVMEDFTDQVFSHILLFTSSIIRTRNLACQIALIEIYALFRSYSVVKFEFSVVRVRSIYSQLSLGKRVLEGLVFVISCIRDILSVILGEAICVVVNSVLKRVCRMFLFLILYLP